MWATIFLTKMLRRESLLNGNIKAISITFLQINALTHKKIDLTTKW